MRILLIILQAAAFLALLAAVLISLWWFAHIWDYSESSSPLNRAFLFIFGSWPISLLIFAAVAIPNIWFVLGPLMNVEDPVRRTLQHLCVIVIETLVLLAIATIAFTTMCMCVSGSSV